MELLNSEEEEDDNVLDYWNNWLPSSNQSQGETSSSVDDQTKKFKKEVVFKSSEMMSVISLTENPKYGNWIPPVNFLNTGLTRNKVLPKLKQKQSKREVVALIKSSGDNRESVEVSEINCKSSGKTPWKKEINLDWGKRIELHDATKLNDSDTFWGIVNLGLFGNIKIWINEYGNICGLAEGKITKIYSSEMTFISITNIQLIRKMLGLSGAQWASVCERLQEIKTTLKFDAFQDYDMTKKNDLEKLWIFVCKRRHLLPDQCMLVKLCGAVKCMRKFQIIPKLLVQDIRNIFGEPIL